MSTIAELTKHGRELMHKAVESTKREFTSIRGVRPISDAAFGCRFRTIGVKWT